MSIKRIIASMALCKTLILISCPMGLGKRYRDKPPFFDNAFYVYKKAKHPEKKSELTLIKKRTPSRRAV